MQTNLRSLVFCTIIILSSLTTEANAKISTQIIDSVCCKPDSLKIVSLNYPSFCVSWKYNSDSACTIPYGFQVQWRPVGTHFWREKTTIYNGGSTTQTFCDTVYACVAHEWRVRSICIAGGVATYSDWVYGPIMYFCADFRKDQDEAQGIEKPENFKNK